MTKDTGNEALGRTVWEGGTSTTSLAVLQPEIDSVGDAMEGKATMDTRTWRDAVRATILRLETSERGQYGKSLPAFSKTSELSVYILSLGACPSVS